MGSRGKVTRLLADLCEGRKEAGDALFPILYDELHALARQFMRKERLGHTLQTTALVHEAYIHLAGSLNSNWEGRPHFLRVAARAMRHVLIDHVRSKRYDKREGKWKRISLEKAPLVSAEPSPDLLDLDDALSDFSELDTQAAQVFELRFFGGLTAEETARVMGVSKRTVMRDWKMARAWLKQRIVKDEEA